MKFTGSRIVKLSKLNLSGDIPQRRKADRVRELGASIKVHGLAQLPVVDGNGNVVIGRDRIAAHMNLGEKTIEVRTVEGTADELKALELTENLHRRRDDIDAVRAEYVAVMERLLNLDVDPVLKPEAGRGRPKTARTKAVEAVAAAQGVTPKAIQKSLERAAALDPEPDESELPAEDLYPLGQVVGEYNDAIEHIAAGLRLVMRDVAKLGRHETLPVAPFERLRQELQRCQQINDGARLVAKCPVCDGGECSLCGGVRFVTGFQMAGVPKDDAPRTLLKAPARKPRMKIELPDGSEYSEPVEDTRSDLP